MSEQILHLCRDTNVKVTKILSEITKREDVTEFVTTVQLVQITINSLLKSQRSFSFELLKDLKTALDNYESLLLQLQRSGRLTRFLTSIRLRKKIEDANSNLHAKLEAFKKSIEEAPAAPTPTVAASPAAQQPPAQEPAARLLPPAQAFSFDEEPSPPPPPMMPGGGGRGVLDEDELFAEEEAASRMAMSAMIEDADGKQIWAELFGLDTFMVPWERFVAGLSSVVLTLQISDDDRSVLQYIIDNQNTGLVNQHKFSELLKAFGPTQNCMRNIKSTLSASWFYGFLTRVESELLLRDQPVGSFLFRFSSSQPGALALAFSTLNESQNQMVISHILIAACQPDGFRIQERGQQPRLFRSLSEIVDFYRMYLLYPMESRLPFEPWFEGEISSAESVEMLTDQQPGTFLLRFSSVPGAYAVTFVGADGSINHSKIEHETVPDLQYEIRVNNALMRFPTLGDYVAFYQDTLLYAYRSVNNQLHAEALRCILKWKDERASQMEAIHTLVDDLFDVKKPVPLPGPLREGFSDPRVDELVARFFEQSW